VFENLGIEFDDLRRSVRRTAGKNKPGARAPLPRSQIDRKRKAKLPNKEFLKV